MITFESNLLYPNIFKIDTIFLEDGTQIAYQVSRDNQNRYWFIAVTTVIDGRVTERHDLSARYNTYQGILDHVKAIPRIISTGMADKETYNAELVQDINLLISSCNHTLKVLNSFKEKYCGKETNNET